MKCTLQQVWDRVVIPAQIHIWDQIHSGRGDTYE